MAEMAEDGGRVKLEFEVKHALIASFVVGLFAGGFFVSAISGFSGPTGALIQDNGDGGPDAAGDSAPTNNNRVRITEEMLANEPTLGSSDAPVTVVEYSDYGCPWCAEWAGVDAIPSRPIDSEDSLNKIIQNYVEKGEVRFVYKDYPVPQLHPNAPIAHVAANCIFEQDETLYWGFHDALFDRRGEWTAGGAGNVQSTFDSIAQDIGADVSAMNACIDSSDGSEYNQDKSEIQQVSGGLGTPTFFIGSVEDGFRKVQGAQPYSTLKPLIDSELSG